MNTSGVSRGRASKVKSDKMIRNADEKFSELTVSQEKEVIEGTLLLKKKAQFTVNKPF